MRRNDREITDKRAIEEFISKQQIKTENIHFIFTVRRQGKNMSLPDLIPQLDLKLTESTNFCLQKQHVGIQLSFKAL